MGFDDRSGTRPDAHPDDAQDACQEILVRIVPRLGSFEGRSKFTTWAYTVAVRSLLRTRTRLVEASVQGAEAFAASWTLAWVRSTRPWRRSSIGCCARRSGSAAPSGMLLCLSRPQRAAYLLADVLGLPDREGAEILGCTREAFRQRVSRARRTLRQVIDNRCGLVDPANPCRCGRQITSSQAAGILDRDRLPLARHAREEVRVWVEPVAKQLDAVVAIGDLYRFDRFAAPPGYGRS
jgi:DNA-directed RNA polymerase specialized sigma24 family protein